MAAAPRVNLRLARLALLAVLSLAPAAVAAPSGEFLPLSEVRPGLRGQARTVVRGTTVETFDVEVLAIVPGAGPSGDLLLVRASGPLIRRTGGIAAGMSGSPVFVGGRLLGAIGFGWSFADHTVGLVTPIEAMLRALPATRGHAPDPAPARPLRRLARPVVLDDRVFTEIAFPADASAARRLPPHVLPALPVARPLLLSAAGTRAAQLLRDELAPLGLVTVEGATGAAGDARPPLVPGSAVGVQLARGDLNAVSIGTLTYRRGDALVAFGHPFLNRGPASFLLTPAVIHDVVRSTAFPFKVGSAGAAVGTVTEDRRAGIGGRIGPLPPMVGVRVQVTDRDRGRTTRLGTQVVRDRTLGPLLVLASAMSAVDRALDRVGEGTARVRLALRGRGLDGPVVRENAFYHGRDIGSAALLELPEALRLLFANEFVATGPVDVTVEVEVEAGRQTATITDAAGVPPRVRRGEALPVRITLRPFQGDAVVRTVELVVPDGFPLGGATVVVRAGGRPTPEQGLPALLLAEPVEPPAPSAAAQLARFAERDRNTDLVVELVPGAARAPAVAADAPEQGARSRSITPWVVRGRIAVPVVVDPR
ncbi:MAG: SpoIVB peptidase S55 domain-containing protein [Armatimonadota bacterium]|nr:SpoIVB peptidase S55 domain-containing protein [Armatimonadota bacterium]MDR7421807.1 SpoIVB peptidase S55 domain-containing protein [Armatimonadota bacterium]MDR7454539.1 SpoIVB peptidase S55 domain-containing protein [Armatimonadota bacterium]MDR7456989.1 SpoIVB peptidase S55 domain-containing protein [Armatimonadota bacterium]MDR7497594.1 SpoIVB peptidase S55 domain-containing protein [Armatimonadota bacterium]